MIQPIREQRNGHMGATVTGGQGSAVGERQSSQSNQIVTDEYIDELRNDHLGLVGGSSAMVALRDLIRRVAASDRPVLIFGPHGSGKWVVAEAIHRVRHVDGAAGVRLARISCSEIGAEGIEQVLFGVGDRQAGLLGEPGTVVLDDVDSLPLPLQGKLLQTLQTGTFQARGVAAAQSLSARVMAITTRSLPRCVREQTFRADLLYELGALTVQVPGLDERRDDIPALVNHFLRLETKNVRFSGEALDLLSGRAWAGNVRELRNLVERVVAFTREPLISREALHGLLSPPSVQESVAASLRSIIARLLELPVDNKLAAVEAALLETAMRASSGNKSAAARLLGVHRKAVERKLEKHRARHLGASETAAGAGAGAPVVPTEPAMGDTEPKPESRMPSANWQHIPS
jgi:DNA-binding NtrC family response regulator